MSLASVWSLDFVNPGLLTGLAVWGVLAFFHVVSLSDATLGRRRASLVCRAVLLGLVVLALAGLSLVRPAAEPFVVFAVDRSASIGAEGERETETFLDAALTHRGRKGAAFLSFAAVPGLVRGKRGEGTEKPPEADRIGTDLAAAVEVAAAAVPPGFVPRVVLLTDGIATAGDVRAAAGQAGAQLWTVPLKHGEDPQVQLAEVRVPDRQVREGEAFEVVIVVTATRTRSN